MPPSNPLIDPETGDIDLHRLYYEARPIAELTVVFVGVALLPFAAAFLFGPSWVGAPFAVLGQFVLAVGAGVVLLYVISRAIQLAAESGGDGVDERRSSAHQTESRDVAEQGSASSQDSPDDADE
ncbi:hypothetical protein [Halopelagius longus]|uniref:Uncharacterized protein n=1 Tax=Halopelagius longus TaxID=1236180 RepID=A0A1H1EMB4_9EURY|nr:hypothetical protein [Halopelagius longus]SDQ89649.1 hypothetical protein SAMN05216278_2965 [Halopelagius longus]